MAEITEAAVRFVAQPMDPKTLARVRLDVEKSALLDPRVDAPALLSDRDHWRAMYQDGLDALVEIAAEVKRLNSELSATKERDTWVVASQSRSGKVTFRRPAEGDSPHRSEGYRPVNRTSKSPPQGTRGVPTRDGGWVYPTGTARKSHYIDDSGRSLCSDWAYLGNSWLVCVALTNKCKSCSVKLKVAKLRRRVQGS